jgi:hypothetical protein
MSSSLEPTFDVVWPKSASAVAQRPLAARLGSLAGARIGFVWDYLFRGDELFPVLAEELRAHGAEVVNYDVFGNIHGPDERALVMDLPNKLQRYRIDAVVVGNGC